MDYMKHKKGVSYIWSISDSKSMIHITTTTSIPYIMMYWITIVELKFYLKIINKLKHRAAAFCNKWQKPPMSGVIVCYISSKTNVYQRLGHKIAFRHVFVASNTLFRYIIFETYAVQNWARYHISSKRFLWKYQIRINEVQM